MRPIAVTWSGFNLRRKPATSRPDAARALTLSPRNYNEKVGLGLFCPITSHAKGYPFEARLPTDLAVSGVALCDQVKSLDWKSRQAQFVCRLPDATVAEIMAKVLALLQ